MIVLVYLCVSPLFIFDWLLLQIEGTVETIAFHTFQVILDAGCWSDCSLPRSKCVAMFLCKFGQSLWARRDKSALNEICYVFESQCPPMMQWFWKAVLSSLILHRSGSSYFLLSFLLQNSQLGKNALLCSLCKFGQSLWARRDKSSLIYEICYAFESRCPPTMQRFWKAAHTTSEFCHRWF